jgi:hypothetical protein
MPSGTSASRATTRVDAEVDELVRQLLETFPECARFTKQQTNSWKDSSWSLTARHAQD